MRNRYAYLIGESQEERTQLLVAPVIENDGNF
jgi:hypothetical protein